MGDMTIEDRLRGDLADTDGARAYRREPPDRFHRGPSGILWVQYGPYREGWGWHVWPDQTAADDAV